MSRPKGIIETKPRRKRNDIGKKRKTYAKKPCIHKKKRRYNRKVGTKTGLWLRAYWRVPMSKDGYKNWDKWLRPKLYKEVTNMKMSPTFKEVPFHMINTKDKFEDFFASHLWKGKFVIMGGSHGKNRHHFKPVKICTIIIRETPQGNVGQITESTRLHRYSWFMKQ